TVVLQLLLGCKAMRTAPASVCMLTVTASPVPTVTLVVVAVMTRLVPVCMAPSGSSGTVKGDAVPVTVGMVPLMLQPPPVPEQNLLAGVVNVELALPSAVRTAVKLTYW